MFGQRGSSWCRDPWPLRNAHRSRAKEVFCRGWWVSVDRAGGRHGIDHRRKHHGRELHEVVQSVREFLHRHSVPLKHVSTRAYGRYAEVRCPVLARMSIVWLKVSRPTHSAEMQ